MEPFFMRFLKYENPYEADFIFLDFVVKALIDMSSIKALDRMIELYNQYLDELLSTGRGWDYDYEMDYSSELRSNIIDYFGLIKDEKIIPTLFKAVREPPDYIAIKAIETLIDMLGEKMIPFLKGIQYALVNLPDYEAKEEIRKFAENEIINFKAHPKNDYQKVAEEIILKPMIFENLSDEMLEEFKVFSIQDLAKLFDEMVNALIIGEDEKLQKYNDWTEFPYYDNAAYSLLYFGLEKDLELIEKTINEIQENKKEKTARKLLKAIKSKLK
jgi:hypothetical protein